MTFLLHTSLRSLVAATLLLAMKVPLAMAESCEACMAYCYSKGGTPRYCEVLCSHPCYNGLEDGSVERKSFENTYFLQPAKTGASDANRQFQTLIVN